MRATKIERNGRWWIVVVVDFKGRELERCIAQSEAVARQRQNNYRRTGAFFLSGKEGK